MRYFLAVLLALAYLPTLSARPQLEYHELERNDPRAGVLAALTVQNMSSSGPYVLTISSCVINQVVEHLELDTEGHVLIGRTGKPLELCFGGLTWGDAVHLSLRSSGGEERAELVVIPYPIRVEDEDGHWALLTRLDRYGSSFGLRAGGYQSDELLQLTLSVDQEIHEQSIQVGSEGTFETVLRTHVPGKPGGVAYVTIASEQSELPMAYHWGGPGG